jgi:multimeric flavodoxin WrbA
MADVIAICGSSRRGGNTEILLNTVLGDLADKGYSTRLIHLDDKELTSCDGCGECGELKDCIYKDDMQDILAEMESARAILLGSPTYFSSATAQLMALLDRAFYVSRRRGNTLRRKIGAAVIAARRAGQNFTFAQLNMYFLISEMVVPGSSYWNCAVGDEKKGWAAEDKEAMSTMHNLAENVAWLLEKLD